jgi:molybdopterin molybdotransferase
VSPKEHPTAVAFEEALRIILEKAVSGRETVEVSVVESLGYVLAEDIVSEIDMPGFDRAAMDGFAYRHADASLGDTFEVIGIVAAGEAPEIALGRNECVQIMTGAPVPFGADTVIKVEQTAPQGEEKSNAIQQVRILSNPSLGANIAFKGEDVSAGSRALDAGRMIRSQEVAILSALGRQKVRVYPGPRIAFAATGEELVEPGRELQLGQIYNSNAYCLWSQVLGAKGIPHSLGVIRDNREDLRQKIGEGLQHDILVLSGGVSMGQFDLVPEVLAELGVEIVFHRLRVKPGQPTLFGVRGKTLVFGLPGNPVATLYAFDQYVAPAIRLFRHHPQPRATPFQGELTRTVRTKPGFLYLVPCVTAWREGRYLLTPLKPHGSADIFSVSGADALALIPAEAGHVDQGQTVTFHRLFES